VRILRGVKVSELLVRESLALLKKEKEKQRRL